MTEKILVVDDEADVLETIGDVLRRAGYQPDLHTDSVTALKDISAGSYDVIVSDIAMPGLDGIQLLTLVKQQSQAPEVIVITAYSNQEVARSALEHGAFAYVEKPFDNDDLVGRVKQALWKRRLFRERKPVL